MIGFSNLFRGLFKGNGLLSNSFGSSYYLNSKAPILIDMNDLMCVVEACPHLALIIQEKAKMFSNMDIQLVKIDDEEERILKHPILNLLKNPNVLQSTEAWLKQYSVMRDIYANNFIYKLQASTKSDPKALWNLPSGQMKVVPTGKIFKQTKIEEIISEYRMSFNAEEVPYQTSEIIFTTENAATIIGNSKIPTLQVPISNIVGALKTRNIIINDRGAMGILSSESKDAAGGIPLNEKERARIEKDYRNKYGIGNTSEGDEQMKIIIANTNVKWSPMSYPTKDLMLFEEIEDDFATILGAYGMDRDIFPSVKGATFENKAQGLKATYQNTIQPEADSLMSTLSDKLGLTEQGLKLIADFSWLPIMQEDELQEAQEKKTTIEGLSIMLRDGVISHEEYAKMAGIEFSGTRQFQQNNNTQNVNG